MDSVATSAGIALLEAGNFRAAAAQFEHELRAEPSSYSAAYNLGLALYKASELAGARKAFEGALAIRPRQPDATLNLARVEIDAGDLDRARELASSLAAQSRGQVLLGHIEEMCGAKERAIACYERALRLDPATVGGWCGLVRMGQTFDADQLEALVDSGQLQRIQESALRFALAQHFDREGQAPRAFGHAARANALRRSNFQPAHYRDLVGALMRAQIPVTSNSELAPIFLIGAPRTGSSLLERILEGHPETRAFGERHDVGLIARELDFPAHAADLTTEALDALAQRYVDGLGPLPAGVTRPIEKTPTNVLTAGLLAAMFPKASFVYLARDVRDVAISNFLINFGDHRVSCSTSIENLHAYLTETERLGRHWEAAPGMRVRRQVYEEFVDDPEGQLRELLAFLGLPWHPDCLRFADRESPCRTASSQQVREPLNRRGIGRWKPYAPFLGPLTQAKR
ncbi:MAG: sulfotransferase [Planctomycetota bacterium]|nr:sulfotransferase [Planctomycetota bacterium]